MSDWAIGDLALCVGGEPWENADNPLNTSGPSGGEVHAVVEIAPDGYLSFAPWPEEFEPCCFRKIRPDQHEPCEDEFVTLLKRGKVSA